MKLGWWAHCYFKATTKGGTEERGRAQKKQRIGPADLHSHFADAEQQKLNVRGIVRCDATMFDFLSVGCFCSPLLRILKSPIPKIPTPKNIWPARPRLLTELFAFLETHRTTPTRACLAREFATMSLFTKRADKIGYNGGVGSPDE